MGTTEFANAVAQVVVEAGKLDQQQAVEDRPYLPLRTLEAWRNTLDVLANRIRTDNGRLGYYLSNAAEWLQMAVWEYERNYGTHADGPAPSNPQEK